MAGSILLVEDNTIARRNIAVFLERAGYQVTQAGTGEDALGLVETVNNYDVVISDLRMPGMVTGLDVLAYQRQVSPHSHSILMTAFGSGQVKNQTTELGARYIEKPINLDALLIEIKTLLAP